MSSKTTSTTGKASYDNQQSTDADLSFGGHFEFDASKLRVALDITVDAVQGAATAATRLTRAILSAAVSLVVAILAFVLIRLLLK